MIQLTLKTHTDYQGQGPLLSAEITRNGERIYVTAIALQPDEIEDSPLNLLELAIGRLLHEAAYPA